MTNQVAVLIHAACNVLYTEEGRELANVQRPKRNVKPPPKDAYLETVHPMDNRYAPSRSAKTKPLPRLPAPAAAVVAPPPLPVVPPPPPPQPTAGPSRPVRKAWKPIDFTHHELDDYDLDRMVIPKKRRVASPIEAARKEVRGEEMEIDDKAAYLGDDIQMDEAPIAPTPPPLDSLEPRPRFVGWPHFVLSESPEPTSPMVQDRDEEVVEEGMDTEKDKDSWLPPPPRSVAPVAAINPSGRRILVRPPRPRYTVASEIQAPKPQLPPTTTSGPTPGLGVDLICIDSAGRVFVVQAVIRPHVALPASCIDDDADDQ